MFSKTKYPIQPLMSVKTKEETAYSEKAASIHKELLNKDYKLKSKESELEKGYYQISELKDQLRSSQIAFNTLQERMAVEKKSREETNSRINCVQATFTQLKGQSACMAESFAKLEESSGAATSKNDEQSAKIARLVQQMIETEEAASKHQQEHENEISSMRSDFDNRQADFDKCVAELNISMDTLAAALEAKKEQLSDLEDKLISTNHEKDRILLEKSDLEKMTNDIGNSKAALAKEVEAQSRTIENLTAEQENLMRRNRDTISNFEAATAESDELRRQIEVIQKEAEEQLAALREQMKVERVALEKERDETKSCVSDLTAKNAEVASELADARTRLEKLAIRGKECDALEVLVKELRLKNSNITDELKLVVDSGNAELDRLKTTFHHEMIQKQKELKEVGALAFEFGNKLQIAEQELVVSKESLSNTLAERNSALKEMKDQLDAEKAAVARLEGQLEENRGQHNTERELLVGSLDRGQEDLSASKAENKSLAAQVEARKKEVEEKNSKIDRLETEVANLTAEVHSARESAKNADERFDAERKKVMESSQQLKDWKTERDHLTCQLKELQQKLVECRSMRDLSDGNCRAAEEKFESSQAEVAQLRCDLDDMKDAKAQREKEEGQLRAELERLQNCLKEKADDLEDANAQKEKEVEQLRVELESLKEKSNELKVLKLTTKARREKEVEKLNNDRNKLKEGKRLSEHLPDETPKKAAKLIEGPQQESSHQTRVVNTNRCFSPIPQSKFNPVPTKRSDRHVHFENESSDWEESDDSSENGDPSYKPKVIEKKARRRTPLVSSKAPASAAKGRGSAAMPKEKAVKTPINTHSRPPTKKTPSLSTNPFSPTQKGGRGKSKASALPLPNTKEWEESRRKLIPKESGPPDWSLLFDSPI